MGLVAGSVGWYLFQEHLAYVSHALKAMSYMLLCHEEGEDATHAAITSICHMTHMILKSQAQNAPVQYT